MRASFWRSPVWLGVPALLVAACAPLHDVSNRPPPCASGTALCETTGVCVSPEYLDYTKPENQGADAKCPVALAVRQGATIVVPVPGATGPDIHLLDASDLMADVNRQQVPG